MAAWMVAVVVGYGFGVHVTLNAVRDAITAKESARAELPSNSLLWDHPEWAEAARRMHAADRAAGELESVLQFWLPVFLAAGIGTAAATLVPNGRINTSNGLDESGLAAVRREHRRARALALLSITLASLSASEFLARWRPDWFVPPLWDSWPSSIAPSVSLLLRAALPLAGAVALAILGVRSIRHARKIAALLQHAPAERQHDRRPGTPVDGAIHTSKPSRVCLQASVLRIRTYGVIAIALATALPVTLGLWKYRGVVADGRFRADDLLFDPELTPLTVLTPIVLSFAVPLLAIGVGLVTAAPWLANCPWRRRKRARPEQCQRCGAFLAPGAEQCWDCGEAVRCAACHHALRADQDLCPECGRPAKRP
jgi:RNA polymerase subunit RPABC4/transcription elongation factor Spt4